MHIYSLCMSYEVDGCGYGSDFEYLTHEEMYSENEFKNICNECLSRYKNKSIRLLRQTLIYEYGFKKLNITSRFEFNKNCE